MDSAPTRTAADDIFEGRVRDELHRARTKFSDSVCSLAALMEEVGELANVLLEFQFAAKKAGGALPDAALAEWNEKIDKEAIQVCVMAMRVALDGDRSLDAIQTSASSFPSAPRA